MSKPLIVVVEDQEDVLEILEYNLEKEGYEVLGFLNTKNLEQAFSEENVSLVIMDRNLPGTEGSEFVEQQRNKGFVTPVLFLSAKDKQSDIEEGFLRGGDDYMTKPFNMNELLLRVKAILRRSTPNLVNAVIEYRDIILNTQSREVTVEGALINLTKLEFDLLFTFITNQNSVLDRDFLLEHVWKESESFQDRTVNVALNRLKEKIDPLKEKIYFKTVRGVGYTLC